MAILSWHFIYTVSLNWLYDHLCHQVQQWGLRLILLGTPFLFFFSFFSSALFSLFKMPPLSHLLQWESHGLSGQKSLPCLLKSNFLQIFLQIKPFSYIAMLVFLICLHYRYLGKLVFSQKKNQNKICHFFVYSSHLLTFPTPSLKGTASLPSELLVTCNSNDYT